MNFSFELAKIIIDSFEEAGVDTSKADLYDLLFVLWLKDKETYDEILKALGHEVIRRILANTH